MIPSSLSPRPWSLSLLLLLGLAGAAGGQSRPKPAPPGRGTPVRAGARPAPRTVPALPPTGPVSLEEADRAYASGNYARALSGYRKALGSGAAPSARIPLLEYRVARCYGLLRQWEAGLSQPLALAERRSGSIWDARCRAWLMELYLAVPHEAYRSAAGLTRVDRPGAIPGGARRVDLSAEDRRQAVRFGEEAAEVYRKLRARLPDTSEESDHLATLARVVHQVGLDEFIQEGQWETDSPVWNLDRDRYDRAWPAARKILGLYDEAERLGTAQQKPLARLARVLWLRIYRNRMSRQAGSRSYPHLHLDPIQELRGLIVDYPGHPEVPHARLLVGDWLLADGRSGEAITVYGSLAADLPESPWGKRARQLVGALQRDRIRVRADDQPPGERASLRVQAPAGAKITLQARRIRLEGALADRRWARPGHSPERFLVEPPPPEDLDEHLHGEPVEWSAEAGDSAVGWRTIPAPIRGVGAYLVSASAGGARAHCVLLVSDLAATQVLAGGQGLVAVSNSRTGAPVAQASVSLWIREGGSTLARQETTGADGLVSFSLPRKDDADRRVSALAWKGDRYAVATASSPAVRPGTGDTGCRLEADSGFAVAGSTLSLRGLLFRKSDAVERPLPGARVRLELRDSAGKVMTSTEADAGPAGEFRARLPVPKGTAPGEYRVTAHNLDDRGGILAQGRLLVGAREGPPLQILVLRKRQPSAERPNAILVAVRDQRSARAAGVAVRWRIVLPQAGQMAVVKGGGRLVTDRTGAAEIVLPTALEPGEILWLDAEDRHGRRGSLLYRPSAVVAESGRRLKLERGFVRAGEPVRGTLSGWTGGPALRVRAVATDGDAAPAGSPFEAPVVEDASGRKSFELRLPRPGCYRLVVIGGQGATVSGPEQEVWVSGTGVEAGLGGDSGIAVVPEGPGRIGAVLRFLIVTRTEVGPLLVTETAEDRLLESRSVEVRGHQAVVEVDVGPRHLPAVGLCVLGVREGRRFQASVTAPIEADPAPEVGVRFDRSGAGLQLQVIPAPGLAGGRTTFWVSTSPPWSGDAPGTGARNVGVVTSGGREPGEGDTERPPTAEPLPAGRPPWRYPPGFGGFDASRPLLGAADRDPFQEALPGTSVVRRPSPPAVQPARPASSPLVPLPLGGMVPVAFEGDAAPGATASVDLTALGGALRDDLLVRCWTTTGAVVERVVASPFRDAPAAFLECPDFVRERDRIRITARIENPGDGDMLCRARLTVSGEGRWGWGGSPPGPARIDVARPDGIPTPARTAPGGGLRRVQVPAGSEMVLDWEGTALGSGRLELELDADLGPEYGRRRVRREIRILQHSAPLTVIRAGVLGADETRLKPAESAGCTITGLELTVFPTARALMREAPRIAPADAGTPDEVLSRIAALFSAAAAIEDGIREAPDARAQQNRELGELLARLRRLQDPSGGWSVAPGGPVDGRLTSVALLVLRAFPPAGSREEQSAVETARRALISRAMEFTARRFEAETGPHTLALLGWALGGRGTPRLMEIAYPRRTELSASGLATLALGLLTGGKRAEAGECLRLLEAAAKPGPAGIDWSGIGSKSRQWYLDESYTLATAVKALQALRPGLPLLGNCVGALVAKLGPDGWGSPRSTSLALIALAALPRQMPSASEIEIRDGTVTGGSRRIAVGPLESVRIRFPIRPLPPEVALVAGGRGVMFAFQTELSRAVDPQAAEGSVTRLARRAYQVDAAVGRKQVRRLLSPEDAAIVGGTLEFELEIRASQALEGVVVEEALPPGAAVLARGGGRDVGGGEALRWVIPALPAGVTRITYRVSLSDAGLFHVPGSVLRSLILGDTRCVGPEAILRVAIP